MIDITNPAPSRHYAGSEWLQSLLGRAKKEISPFGRIVADLLGELYQGIYHIQRHCVSVDWSDPDWIEISVPMGSMATVDADELTRLVFLAHLYCVRVQLRPSGPRLVKLAFSPRIRTGGIWETHPTLDEAVARFKERYA